MMESRMTRNCHVRFGERYEETRLPRGRKVRFVPTPFSPLLANIALHGMEELIKKKFPKKWKGKKIIRPIPTLIRYADDFVILHENIETIKECKVVISEWLKPIGLELKPSKTKYSNTLYEYEGNVGFDFLGFTIRQFEVGKYRSAKNPQGKRLGFVTQIQPSRQKQEIHLKKIAKIINNFKSQQQSKLISKLNPIIRGWANYYSTIFASKTFNRMDYLVWQKLRAWALYSCNSTNKYKVVKKYWHKKDNENWRFGTNNGLFLAKYIDTKTKIHIKVQGRRSPYDGDYVYWGARLGHHPELPSQLAILLHEQKGKCEWCKLHFFYGDLLEKDHIIPTSKGGKDEYSNLQILHRHCHDKKTYLDMISTDDKTAKNKEERIEMKVS